MTTDSTGLITRLARVHTALVSDVLDSMGLTPGFVGPAIRPVEPGMKLAGRAMTVLYEPVEVRSENPYQVLMESFDHLTDGDVVVISTTDLESALWGELLSTAARARGAVGAIMDGHTRDTAQIIDMEFPTFAAGTSPLDSAGRQEAVSYGEPVRCGWASVASGDYVLADEMGVVVIPQAAAADVVAAAEAKDAGESTVRAELEAGASVAEVFARHGIL